MSSSRYYYQDRGGRGGRYQPNYSRGGGNSGNPPSGGGALRRAAPRDERSERQTVTGKKVCEEYAFKDCRFSHGLRCIGTRLEAHSDRILNMAIGKTAKGYQMFTTGKDCTLIRWELVPQGGTPANSQMSNEELSALFPAEATKNVGTQQIVTYSVNLATSTPLPALPTCLYLLDDLLLVATTGGLIQGFEAKSNSQFTVPGHAKDVNAMLITKSPPNATDPSGRPIFSPAQTTKADFPVTRLMHIENTYLLIVGGIGCVGIYDMSSNSWGPVWRSELLPPNQADNKRVVCLAVTKVDAIYLAVFTCGEGLCINAQGQLEGRITLPIPPHGDMLFSADWTINRLIAGYGNGSLMGIDLKTLQSDWSIVAHENQVRQIEAIDNFFVTVSADASIGVWRLSDGSDNKVPPASNRGRR